MLAHIGTGDAPKPTQKKRPSSTPPPTPQWEFNKTLLENKMYTIHMHKLIQTHLDEFKAEEEREQVSELWELNTTNTNNRNTSPPTKAKTVPRD